MKLLIIICIITIGLYQGCKKNEEPIEPNKSYIHFTVKPDSLNFGSVPLFSSKILYLTIINNNTSQKELRIKIISNDEEITIEDKSEFVIKSNDSLLIPIKFSPKLSKEYIVFINIFHNSSLFISPLKYKIIGTGDSISYNIIKLKNEAWELFQSKNYLASRSKFETVKSLINNYGKQKELLGEIICGIGWNNLMLKEYLLARINFSDAINNSVNDKKTTLNSNSGLCFLYFNTRLYSKGIEKGKIVLESDTNYVFDHFKYINYKRIHLCIIQCYFYLGDFINAAKELDKLDPQNAPHSSDPKILMRMIQELNNKI